MTQSDGFSEDGEGGVGSAGLAFIEKRCLALSETAVRISANVGLRDLRRGHCICGFCKLGSSVVHCISTFYADDG